METHSSMQINANVSMRMARRAEPRDEVVIARCEFEAGASRLLSHGRAVELLPRRVMLWIRITSVSVQPLAASGEIGVGDQDVGPALAEIDADSVAGLEQSKPAASRGLRRSV